MTSSQDKGFIFHHRDRITEEDPQDLPVDGLENAKGVLLDNDASKFDLEYSDRVDGDRFAIVNGHHWTRFLKKCKSGDMHLFSRPKDSPVRESQPPALRGSKRTYGQMDNDSNSGTENEGTGGSSPAAPLSPGSPSSQHS
eukprot:TRINITY_DN15781_c0_g1::TRINITY_DN15781_c0_g1_i1::g.25614::m.25614 TRINITY_DN15781_c0_g1::TRINITY_DN15781_c0_g1_i1::g.25614  ORF type:complete len:140 (-),score=9.07 TRINITY_DN15781_c0_g1_i1:177-596(-)